MKSACHSVFNVSITLIAALFCCCVSMAQARAEISSVGRTAKGIVAAYQFGRSVGISDSDESKRGNVVRDLTDGGLDLELVQPNDAKWSDQGLTIGGKAYLKSTTAAKKLNLAIVKSGQLTIETWVTTNKLDQAGPARVVSLSRDTSNRNVTLGQQNASFDIRLRTTGTSVNGLPSLATPSEIKKGDPMHVVYTRDRGGDAKVFVNGVQVAAAKTGGATNNWNADYQLFLGNEADGSRPWTGTFHLVALYDRSLSRAEIERNHDAGPTPRFVVPPPRVLTDNQQLFESKVLPIFAQHCAECHDSVTSEGGLDMTVLAAFKQGGSDGPAIVAGDAAASHLWQRVASDEMPEGRDPLSKQQKTVLRDWIDGGAEWSTDRYDAVDYMAPSERPTEFVRRLTLTEYVRTVQATFGVDISKDAAELLPRAKRADGFANTAYNLNVDLKHVEAYQILGLRIAERIDAAKFARRFSKQRLFTDKSVNALIEPMGAWVLRGPLTKREVTNYRGITTTVASSGGDFDEAVRYVVAAMAQSPRFLYRIEKQQGDGRRLTLNDFEVASRLSFLVWGESPDQKLHEDAKQGKLDREGIVAHADRMLKHPKAITRSIDFLRQWINLERMRNLRPDAEMFPDWDAKLAEDMQRETEAFFVDVVWDQSRPLADLLVAQTTFLTPELAEHYGIKPKPDDFEQYDLTMVSHRGGLLTHGSLLTIGGDNASMVTRGLFVLRDLLNGEVGDPPPGLDTTPVPTSPGRTHRAIATDRIESASCGGCHSRFEPLAFGLEKFDGLGGFSETDRHGNRLREDGEVLVPGETTPRKFETSAELMKILADSPRVKRTLVRKVIQFSIGRPLVLADRAEVEIVYQNAMKNGLTYPAIVRAIAVSNFVTSIHSEAAVLE